MYNIVNFGLLLLVIGLLGFQSFGWFSVGLMVVFGFLFSNRFIWFLLCVVVVGRLFLMVQDDVVKMEQAKGWAEQVVTSVFEVCAEPDVRREQVKYSLCSEQVDFKILMNADMYPRYEYGDLLEGSLRFELPEKFEGFNYPGYLKITNVYLLGEKVSYLNKIGNDGGWIRKVYVFKEKLLANLQENLQEPNASLAAGLILGVRRGFNDELMLSLNRTGLTHLIAVSGYNISLIILFVTRVLFFVPRTIRFVVITGFLMFFCLLAGMGPSVVRAVIMGVLSILALELGRQVAFFRVLLVTFFVMFFWSPYQIWHDVGFHLSFLSTIGVAYLSDWKFLRKVPSVGGLKEAFVLAVSSQFTTLPVTVFNFGVFSIVSPLANLAVAPLMPILMMMSFVILVSDWMLVLKPVVILIYHALGSLFFSIVKFMASFGWASLGIEKQSWWFLVGYSVIVLIVFFINLLRYRRLTDL